MTDVATGVAAENLPFATPIELRNLADIAEQLNTVHNTLENAGNTLYVDDVTIYDEAGGKLAVLEWRMEADSFGLRIGD